MGFDKNLINSYELFFLEYEISYDLSTFCKNCISGKNLLLKLWAKNIYTNQNAGFLKSKYLRNSVRYELGFLDMVKNLQKQQINSVISSGCGQACQDIPKVKQDGEST